MPRGSGSCGRSIRIGVGQTPRRWIQLQFTSTLVDNYDDNSQDTALWVVDQFADGTVAGVTVAETGGQLQVTGPISVAAVRYSGYVSVSKFVLDASYVSTGHTTCQVGEVFYFGVGPDANNAYYAFVDSNTLYFFKRVGGVGSILATVATWSPTTHKRFRLRWSGNGDNTVYLDTATSSSSDPPIESDWTNRASAARDAGIDLSAAKQAVGGGAYASIASPTTSIFDGFNSATTIAATQTLTPSLFTNSQTFYTPTVTAGTTTLTPSLFTNSQTFYSPTVTAGSVTLTPSLFTNSQTFYAPTITPGAVTLTPALFTNNQTFYSPVVTPGEVTLTPNLFTNTQIFYGPTVTPGSVTILPDLFTNSQTFFTPTVSPGLVTLTPALVTNSQTFYSPTVTQIGGDQTLLPSLFTNAQIFYAPLVSPGQVTLTPALFTNSQTFFSPTILPGSVTLLPDLFTNSQIFYSPSVAHVVFVFVGSGTPGFTRSFAKDFVS